MELLQNDNIDIEPPHTPTNKSNQESHGVISSLNTLDVIKEAGIDEYETHSLNEIEKRAIGSTYIANINDSGSAKRSILRQSQHSTTFGPSKLYRPSVSFAKKKEIITFRPSVDSSTTSNSNTPVAENHHEIHHVMLSPLSERNMESSRDSTESGKENTNIFLDIGVSNNNSPYCSNLTKTKNTNTCDTNDMFSPLGSEASYSWSFPSIEEIAFNSSQTPSKKFRCSLLSSITSPAPVYRFQQGASSPNPCYPLEYQTIEIRDTGIDPDYDILVTPSKKGTNTDTQLSFDDKSQTNNESSSCLPTFTPASSIERGAYLVYQTSPYVKTHNITKDNQLRRKSLQKNNISYTNTNTILDNSFKPNSLFSYKNKHSVSNDSNYSNSPLIFNKDKNESSNCSPMYSRVSKKDEETKLSSSLKDKLAASIFNNERSSQIVSESDFDEMIYTSEIHRNDKTNYLNSLPDSLKYLKSNPQDSDATNVEKMNPDYTHLQPNSMKLHLPLKDVETTTEMLLAQENVQTYLNNTLSTKESSNGVAIDKLPEDINKKSNLDKKEYNSVSIPPLMFGLKNMNIMNTSKLSNEFYTPRGFGRKLVGPIKVSQIGIWERLQNGIDIITPRPTEFSTYEVNLKPSNSNELDIPNNTLVNVNSHQKDIEKKNHHIQRNRNISEDSMSESNSEESMILKRKDTYDNYTLIQESVTPERRVKTSTTNNLLNSDNLPPIMLDKIDTPCYYIDDLNDENTLDKTLLHSLSQNKTKNDMINQFIPSLQIRKSRQSDWYNSTSEVSLQSSNEKMSNDHLDTIIIEPSRKTLNTESELKTSYSEMYVRSSEVSTKIKSERNSIISNNVSSLSDSDTIPKKSISNTSNIDLKTINSKDNIEHPRSSYPHLIGSSIKNDDYVSQLHGANTIQKLSTVNCTPNKHLEKKIQNESVFSNCLNDPSFESNIENRLSVLSNVKSLIQKNSLVYNTVSTHSEDSNQTNLQPKSNCEMPIPVNEEIVQLPEMGIEWNDLNQFHFNKMFVEIDLSSEFILYDNNLHQLIESFFNRNNTTVSRTQDDTLFMEYSTQEAFTPEGLACIIDIISFQNRSLIEYENNSEDNNYLKLSHLFLQYFNDINNEKSLLELSKPIVLDGIKSLLSLFQKKAKIESWFEALRLLKETWTTRINNLHSNLKLFPKTRIACLLKKYQLSRQKNKDFDKSLNAILSNINERIDYVSVLALGQWKVDVSLTSHYIRLEQLQATLLDIKGALHDALKYETSISKAYEHLVSKQQHNSHEYELYEIKKDILEQLKESVNIEYKQKERTQSQYNERYVYYMKLKNAVVKGNDFIYKLKLHLDLYKKKIFNLQAIIRLLICQRDFLEYKQKLHLFKLTSIDFDFLRIELIPRYYKNSNVFELWDRYIQTWITSAFCKNSHAENLEKHFVNGFSQWICHRNHFIENLTSSEIQNDYTQGQLNSNVVLHNLAINPLPKIFIWWRYNLTDFFLNQSESSKTNCLYEGLKIQMKTGLINDFNECILPEFLPQGCLLANNDLHQLKIRIENSMHLEVILPVYFDYRLRQFLYEYTEKKIDFMLNVFLEENNLPKRSSLESLLNTNSLINEIPLQLFAPITGIASVIQCSGLTLQHCNRIEMLIQQQRHLLMDYKANIVYGNTLSESMDSILLKLFSEINTIPSILPPNDECISFVISLFPRSCSSFVNTNYITSIILVFVCDIALSLMFSSFVHGIHDSYTKIYINNDIEYVISSQDQVETYKKHTHLMQQYKYSIREFRCLNRLPRESDFVDLIKKIEDIAFAH